MKNVIALSVTLFILVAGAYAQGPFDPDPNTVMLLHFDECSGNIAYDASVHGHDGTFNPIDGPAWDAGGRFGCCLSFDGQNDSVRADILDMGFMSGPHTIESTIKITSLPTSKWATIVCLYSLEQQIPLRVFPDGRVHFRVIKNNQHDYVDLFSESSLTIGKWYHLAGQYDGVNIAIYIDGVLDSSKALGFTPVAPARNAVDIGKMRRSDLGGDDHRNWFNGLIDEVRISSVARFLTEILVSLDIKPSSCPNPLNVKKPKSDVWIPDPDQPVDAAYKAGQGLNRAGGVLPGAIPGTADLDVANIDPATITLEGVPALRWAIEDVSTPVGDGAAECECSDAGPDGYPDLTIKFDKSSIITALGIVYDGDTIPLTITGQLIDGTPFEGTDCVIIRGSTAPALASTPVLQSNYPNPFNPVTQISFSLPDAAEVSLEIYNIMGQQVATIVDGPMEAGTHTVQWDGSDVASGIYFYRIQAGDIVETKKMVLLK